MDLSMLQVATTMTVWFWPMWKLGTEEFGKKVGGAVGEDFVKLYRKVLNQAGLVGSESRDQAEQKISTLLQRNRDTAGELFSQSRLVVKELLWSDRYFSMDDLIKIMAATGYTIDEFAFSATARRVPAVNGFVDQVWPRTEKAAKLVEKMCQLNPDLSSKD